MSQLVDLMQLLDVAHLLDYWPTWGVLVFAFPWAFCKIAARADARLEAEPPYAMTVSVARAARSAPPWGGSRIACRRWVDAW
jgi:hypothetical protein